MIKPISWIIPKALLSLGYFGAIASDVEQISDTNEEEVRYQTVVQQHHKAAWRLVLARQYVPTNMAQLLGTYFRCILRVKVSQGQWVLYSVMSSYLEAGKLLRRDLSDPAARDAFESLGAIEQTMRYTVTMIFYFSRSVQKLNMTAAGSCLDMELANRKPGMPLTL